MLVPLAGGHNLGFQLLTAKSVVQTDNSKSHLGALDCFMKSKGTLPVTRVIVIVVQAERGHRFNIELVKHHCDWQNVSDLSVSSPL